MPISPRIFPFLLLFLLFQIPGQMGGAELKDKAPERLLPPATDRLAYPPAQVPGEELDTFLSSCIKTCMRRSQMVAMGFDTLQAGCRRQCEQKGPVAGGKQANPEEKYQEIHQLCLRAEEADGEKLLSLLKQDMVERTGVWAEIIPTLARLKEKQAVSLLIDLARLPDEDWLGRVMAVQALGDIGDSRAVPVLLQAAWRPETRDAAIASLTQIPDIRATTVFISAIQPEEDPQTQQFAARGLVELGADAVDALSQELANYSKEERQRPKRIRLCQILAEMNNTKARNVLLVLAHDQDPAVQLCAQNAL